ncbi:nitrogenase component 1 [Megasphaera paucivorans]|uniref:Nitrogenase component 1 type Oxidoreductase n=1 Tax=Megasphaera paucivorans TaxID=349095 RepID=A0A1H0AZL2_9FIRM|nr:nitrogenase component 1 [Megasphaera paucivorans]SDN38854.1 Nitrogenase component 1 type Oxidoreductase [Megasphaera paucivorans]
MKGLWKYISPFAPDQSGACSVFYGLGGIVVIVDAGGCAGNVCGFDEPRWFGKKSAIFSAGLRDMDAILGRDTLLVEKLCAAAADTNAMFAVFVGTPVPAVIGTDYQALRRMAEKKLRLPVMTVDTTGMNLYDVGIEKAYLELFRTFAAASGPIQPETVGVIGATPLDMTCLEDPLHIENMLIGQGWSRVLIYGRNGLSNIQQAGVVAKNLVIAPAGMAAAVYLEKKFGTPYTTAYPVLKKNWVCDFTGKKILIVHQQILANALRQQLLEAGASAVTVASWFMLNAALKEPYDIALREEEDFIQLADNQTYDIVIGDGLFRKALKHFMGMYLELPHFAVSGRM